MTAFMDRMAGAPISWGVCEVPGWGWQLDSATVLSQMRRSAWPRPSSGRMASCPMSRRTRQERWQTMDYGLLAASCPSCCTTRRTIRSPRSRRALEGFVAAGAGTLVLAAATGTDGYDARPVLDDAGWRTLLTHLDRLDRLAGQSGVTATLHPHVGTMVETADDVERVLAGSGIGLCLDTGHLLIGGADPVALAAEHAGRIRHTHLKDVDATWARRVQSGEVTYTDAVRQGMYRPLGQGDVDIAAIVGSLEGAGYDGWYVLEQDTILPGPLGAGELGPIADVRASLEHLRTLARSTA